MISSNDKRRGRRGSAAGVFVGTWTAVIAAAIAVAILGIALAGGAPAFRDWMAAATPYALLWRIAVYAIGGTLYITHWRPRLRTLQRQQADGGAASHARLVKVERMLVIALVAIEVANLPGLIDWIRG